MDLEQDREELLSKHKKELKELRGKIQGIKSSVPKGDKKRKKQATEEIAKLENETAARHAAEMSQLESKLDGECAGEAAEASAAAAAATATASCPDEEGTAVESDMATEDSDVSSAGPKMTKAQRRKLKKEQEAKERDERFAEASKAAVNSDRSVEMRTLTSMLDSLSLRVHQVEADGNCLYHALAYQLHNRKSEADMLSLRRQAANFMLRHRDDFEAFVEDAATQPSESSPPTEDFFERYCRNVAETAMWGGQLEIQAISRALERKVVVYQAGCEAITIGDDTISQPLRLVYHRHDLGTGEHYNAAIPSAAAAT
ncbi:deubiquitinase OTUD6B-like [Sycon ciliatum]|uniref:deubiquitinase OTUD6B-like n=1 Tax=Sycon ciliatum TaxID=27933 RepID=UPI0031F69BCD